MTRDAADGQALLAAEAPVAALLGTLEEQLQELVPELLVDIDQHLAADDHLHLVELGIPREVVAGEPDPLAQVRVHDRRVMAGVVVVGERRAGPAVEEVLAPFADDAERGDAGLARLDGRLAG